MKKRIALGPWTRGESDEAECSDDCDWADGPDEPRKVMAAARAHARETGHTVIHYRTWTRLVETPR